MANELIKKYLSESIERQNATFLLEYEKENAYFHEAIFTPRRTNSLKWDAVNANVSNFAATVQTLGSKAKIAKRDDINLRSGKIAPILQAYNLDEEMLILLQQGLDKDIVTQALFDDALNSYNSVRARLSAIAMQELSTGTVVYNTDNNKGGLIETFINYDLESWQSVNVGTAWSTSATATPLEDLRDALQVLHDRNIYPDFMRMTRATFNQMIKTTEVKTGYSVEITKNNIKSSFLSVGDMNVFFASKEFPVVEIVQDDVSYQNSDGSLDNTRRGWAEGIVQFGFKNEGRRLWVTPGEETHKTLSKAITTMVNGTVIQRSSTLDPFAIKTMAKGITFPVWDKSTQTLLLDTTP